MKLVEFYLFSLLLSMLLIVDGYLTKTDLNELMSFDCNEALVTLYVYSSQPNPTWMINLTQMIKMKSLVNKLFNDYDNETISMKSTKRVLGYQGFSVSCSTQKEVFVNGIISIENQLLDSGRSYLPSSIVDHVNEHIGESIIPTTYRKLLNINCDRVPIKGPDSVPAYNPQTDNGGCFITKQLKNNCYAYATDIVTNTFPQPGRSSGKTASPVTCESVRKACIRDGLIYNGTKLPPNQPKSGHYVALFIWPNRDYHWIRKDSNGYWSHKPGSGSITNRDNAGSFIHDPQKSNFSPWTIFCAYYVAQPSKVHIS